MKDKSYSRNLAAMLKTADVELKMSIGKKYDIKKFQYIKSNVNPHKTADTTSAINNIYSKEDIKEKFIIRDCNTNLYYVLNNGDDAINFINQLPAESRTFHEVIFGFQQQKLKIDIDMKEEDIVKLSCDAQLGNLYDGVDVVVDMNTSTDTNVDVNVNLTTTLTVKQKVQHILDMIIEKIKDTFYVLYFIEDVPLIITTNGGLDALTNTVKYSFHIIIDGYYVQDNIEAQIFTKTLLSVMPLKYQIFIDAQVNKAVQCFRIIGCQKTKTNRFKKILSSECMDTLLANTLTTSTTTSSLITNITNCKPLDTLNKLTNDKKLVTVIDSDLSSNDITEILKISKDVTRGFILRINKGNLLIFERKFPTYCFICCEVHHTDNTLLLSTQTVELTPAVSCVNIYMKCRHMKGKAKYIGKIYKCVNGNGVNNGVSNNSKNDKSNELTEFIKEAKEKEKEKEIENVLNWKDASLVQTIDILDKVHINNTNLFDKLPAEQKTVYDESTMRSYENAETLVIKAAMKLGKSKKLKEFIDNLDVASNATSITPITPSKIVILAFRQTWSSSVKENLPDFTLYSDVKGKLTQNRVIVQIESLQRLQIIGEEPPDCLILDECESIFEQFDSGHIKDFNAVFAAFQYLIKYSKRVIFMDAHISDRTYRLIERFRGIKHVHYHFNQNKNATADKYFITSKEPVWLKELLHAITNGKKVCIPISSLSEGSLIYEYLIKEFPNKRIKIYSSLTSQEEKKEHFGNVHLHWTELDVLIYTPTVSAGISYELEHFDVIFGYFTNHSCTVETCLQMIGRVRNIRTHEFYICFNTINNNLPIEANEIEYALCQNRQNLFKSMAVDYLSFEYGPDSSISYKKTDYYYIWLENTIIKNISSNNFEKRFISYILDVGSSCVLLENRFDDEELFVISDARKMIKQTLKEQKINAIVEARDLSDEEITVIQDKFIRQESVVLDDLHAYEKFRLRRDYNVIDTYVITYNFIDQYLNSKVKRQYRNLKRINKYANLNDSLIDIQKSELAYFTYNMNQGTLTKYEDLHHNYTYEKHRLACGLLVAMGFDNLYDPKWLPIVSLYDNLRKNEKIIYKSLAAIQTEFKISKNKNQLDSIIRDDYISKMIKFINQVITAQYGMKITSDKNWELFQIAHSDLFTIDITDPTKPYVGLSLDVNDDLFENDNPNMLDYDDQ